MERLRPRLRRPPCARSWHFLPPHLSSRPRLLSGAEPGCTLKSQCMNETHRGVRPSARLRLSVPAKGLSNRSPSEEEIGRPQRQPLALPQEAEPRPGSPAPRSLQPRPGGKFHLEQGEFPLLLPAGECTADVQPSWGQPSWRSPSSGGALARGGGSRRPCHLPTRCPLHQLAQISGAWQRPERWTMAATCGV